MRDENILTKLFVRDDAGGAVDGVEDKGKGILRRKQECIFVFYSAGVDIGIDDGKMSKALQNWIGGERDFYGSWEIGGKGVIGDSNDEA